MRLRALVTTSLGFASSFVPPPLLSHPPQWSPNRIVRPIVVAEELDNSATTIVLGLGYHHQINRGGSNSESEGTTRFRLYARKSSRNGNGNSRFKRPPPPPGCGGGTTSDKQINEGGVLEVNPV